LVEILKEIESGHYDGEVINYSFSPSMAEVEIHFWDWRPDATTNSNERSILEISAANPFAFAINEKSAIDISFHPRDHLVWDFEPKSSLVVYRPVDFNFLFSELEKRLTWKKEKFEKYFDLSNSFPSKGFLPHSIYNECIKILEINVASKIVGGYENLKTLTFDSNFIMAEEFEFRIRNS